MKAVRHLLAWLFLGIALTLSLPSFANELCIPEASGVPGYAPEYPRWWDSSDTMGFQNPDDPRWRGSSQHGGDFRMRVLQKQVDGASHFSLLVSLDDVPMVSSPSGAYVWLGVATGDGPAAVVDDCASQVLYRFSVANPSASMIAAVAKTTTDVSRRNYQNLTNTCPFKPSTDPGKIFVTPDGIRLLVPLPNPRPNKLRVFVALTDLVASAMATATWPLGIEVPYQDELAPNIQKVPFRDTWGTLTLHPLPCANGIHIQPSDIGVVTMLSDINQTEADANANPPIAIGPSFIKKGTTNIFVARVRGLTGLSAIQRGALHTRFRIAGWGSAPLDASGYWQLPGNNNNCQNVPLRPQSVSGNGDIGFFEYQNNHCDWLVPQTDVGMSDHQCVLVELTAGADVSISSDSAYRNMQFASASMVSRIAHISTQGLGPLKTGSREMLIHVRKSNMPADKSQQFDPMREMSKAIDSRIEATKRRYRHLGDQQTTPQPKDGQQQAAPQETLPDPVAAELALLGNMKTAVNDETIPYPALFEKLAYAPPQVLDTVMPSIVIDVFHETGETFVSNGTTHKVFRRQPSFGLNVAHKGAVFGWASQLLDEDGASLQAVPNRPNWYWLSTPANGTKKLQLRIATIDRRGIDPFVTQGHGHTDVSSSSSYAGTGPCGHCATAPPQQDNAGNWWLVLQPLLLGAGFWLRRRAWWRARRVNPAAGLEACAGRASRSR